MNDRQLQALEYLITTMIDLRVLQLKNGDSPQMRNDVRIAGKQLMESFPEVPHKKTAWD